jgi:hypothetical protein
MKKQTIAFWATVFFFFGIALFSCKKNESDLEQQVEHARDLNEFEAEMSELVQVLDLAASKSGLRGGREESFAVCGASIDSLSVPGTIILNFDGTTPCVNGTRKRSGQIKLKLSGGRLWLNAGAELRIEFVNYKITWLASGRSQIFNGIKTVKNVSGGSISVALEGVTFPVRIIHEISGKVNVTFDGGRTAEWNFARRRETNVLARGNVEVSLTGIGAASGRNNLAAWGKNRFGGDFFTVVQTAVAAKSSCGWHKPTGGVILHDGQFRDVTVTLGTDASGNPAGGCPTHFKVSWQGVGGATRTRIIAYAN